MKGGRDKEKRPGGRGGEPGWRKKNLPLFPKHKYQILDGNYENYEVAPVSRPGWISFSFVLFYVFFPAIQEKGGHWPDKVHAGRWHWHRVASGYRVGVGLSTGEWWMQHFCLILKSCPIYPSHTSSSSCWSTSWSWSSPSCQWRYLRLSVWPGIRLLPTLLRPKDCLSYNQLDLIIIIITIIIIIAITIHENGWRRMKWMKIDYAGWKWLAMNNNSGNGWEWMILW